MSNICRKCGGGRFETRYPYPHLRNLRWGREREGVGRERDRQTDRKGETERMYVPYMEERI